MSILAIAMIVSGVVLSVIWTIMIVTDSYPAWMDDNEVILFSMALGFVPVMGLVIAGGISLGGWLTFWKAFFWVEGPMVGLYYIINIGDARRRDPKSVTTGFLVLIGIIGIVSLLLLAAAIQILNYTSGGVGEWFRWLLSYR